MGTVTRLPLSGRELLYKSRQNELVAVNVLPGDIFATGEQRVLFPLGTIVQGWQHQRYDITPDDQRFVMIHPTTECSTLILVQNSFEELKAKVGS